MKFNELDNKMRVFETAFDQCVLPGIYMVARLDGRNFSGLTEDRFEKPFDVGFRDLMVATTEYLMNSGFKVLYAYTESDEISLLFDTTDETFGRKIRKFNSVLAGCASATFTYLFDSPVTFDCRISQLPTKQLVSDYFRWRNEDSCRNALNGFCYWTLRQEAGESARAATSILNGMSVPGKNELLFSYGINFNDIPNWMKRGTGLYWEEYEKDGENPITGEVVRVVRRRIKADYHLPMKEEYSDFVRSFVETEKWDGQVVRR